MSADQDAKKSVCAGCGKVFVCGVAAGLANCWCMEKPVGLPVAESGTGCYCPTCLELKTRFMGEPVRSA